MEEELSGEVWMGVEAGLASVGLDLLDIFKGLAMFQKRNAEMFEVVHSS